MLTGTKGKLKIIYVTHWVGRNSNKIHKLSRKLADAQPFNISQKEGQKVFLSISWQLSPPFHNIFNKSLKAQQVSKVWKDAVVILVPKSFSHQSLNDFRPVALTLIVIKTFEKTSAAWNRQENRALTWPYAGIEDATATLLNLLFIHLGENGSMPDFYLLIFPPLLTQSTYIF